ncbi:hypothetical protein ASD11_01180 [Aeromicrobium sp. Root495]|nr:hypothetical protein ASD11_01180 [Aeromicrobium sp. Root495]
MLDRGSGPDWRDSGDSMLVCRVFRGEAGDTLVYPTPQPVPITNPPSSVELEVGEPYRFASTVAGEDVIVAFVTAGAGDLLMKDLVPVDPSTLEPSSAPEPAWFVALQEVQEGVETIPEQVSAALAADENVVAAAEEAVAGAVAGIGVVTTTQAPEYLRNRFKNPQLKGGLSGGSTGSSGVSQNIVEITTGLPSGFSYGIENTRVAGSGTTSVWVGYLGGLTSASPYVVPVTPGEVISIGAMVNSQFPTGATSMNARIRARFYKADDTSLSQVDGTATALATDTWEFRATSNITVPADAHHVVVEVIVSAVGATSVTGVKTRATGAIVISGTLLTADMYGDGTRNRWGWKGAPHTSESVRLFRSTAEDAKLNQLLSNGLGVAVTITGTTFTVTETVDSKPLVTTMKRVSSKNGGFTFDTKTFNGAACQVVDDQITPIRTQLDTVGAGHGYICMAVFDNPDGKTGADIGSVWTDGSREYVLAALTTDNKLKVIGSYAGTPVTSANVNPTSNLTHVSGATHTGAIVYTTKVTGSAGSGNTMLSPGSTTRNRLSLWLDGIELTADGTYYGREFIVRETYEVVDYASLYDALKANIGQAIVTTAATAAGAVLVQNVYSFRGAGTMLITATLDELKPTTLGWWGAIQTMPLAIAGMTTRRYVPGMGTVGGIDWSAGTDYTSYAATNILTAAAEKVAGQISPFHLDTVETGGIVQLGFVGGYLPFRASSAARSARRLTNSASQLWDMRNNKKAYPTLTTGEAAGWGHIEAVAFHAHLSPAQVASVLQRKNEALTSYAALASVAGLAVA